ncbi:hypothetical protein [Escherichia phage vB_EcoM-LTH01]
MSQEVDNNTYGLPTLRFYYRNWKGDCGYRTVTGTPVMWYGESPYHRGEQWFMKAYDVDKQDIRDFAVADVIEFFK